MLKLDVLAAELNLWANETEQIYRATKEIKYRGDAKHLRYLAATLNQSSLPSTGVTSFNTRVGDVVLSSLDVTTALGYNPVTQARTLTINGVTYDLSANRSWTISTAIPTLAQVTTAGNTTTNAIGVGIGVSDPLDFKFVVQGVMQVRSGPSSFSGLRIDSTSIRRRDTGTFSLGTNDSTSFNIFAPTNNIGINTTTDAGYKLDVNGSVRAQGGVYVSEGQRIEWAASREYLIGNGGRATMTLNQGGNGLAYSLSIVASGFNQTSGTGGVLSYAPTINPTSGTAVFNLTNIAPTINQTGGANGITRGLYINPTITAAADFRAIETTVGNVLLCTTSGNVGIGTTSPTYNLEVSTTGYSGIGVMSGANSLAEISFQNRGYALPRWTIRATGAPNGSSGELTFQRLASSFDLTIKSTGNVLIGTTTDAGYKLDVNGTIRVSGTIRVGSTFNGTLATLADFRGAGDSDFIQIARETDTNRGVKIYASGMIIASSVETSGAAYSFLNNGSGSASSGNRLFFNISGGWAPTSGTASWDQVRLNPTINTTGTYAGIVRGIYYNPTLTSLTGTTHRAIETTSGNVIFNGGNVGIGTTAPLKPLHINTNNNDSSLSFIISNELAAGRAGLSFNLPNNGNEFYSIGVDADRFLKIANSPNLVTNARIAISPSGNVLINTTTDAGYKLDVSGSTRIKGTGTTDSTIALLVQNNTGRLLLQTDDGGFTRIGGPTARLYVGVESGGATARLVVNGKGLFSDGGIGNAGGFYIDQGGTSSASRTIWYDGSGTPKNLITGNGDNYITSGNFGLGTSTPTDKLHIVDNTNGNKFARISAGGTDASAAWVAQNDQVDNVVYRVFGSGVTGTQMGQALARSASLLANLGGTGKFLIGTYSSTDLIFGTGDQARMRLVDSTGNFLIGTMTDTGNKLTVSGNIDAQGYKVNNVLGFTGIFNVPTNPPGSQNLDIQGGIIVNVF